VDVRIDGNKCRMAGNKCRIGKGDLESG
jgi:hypothetical protein